MGRLILLLGVLFTAGCAHYEYDLTQPEALRRHIGGTQTTVRVEPLVYDLVSFDNKLVMVIENPTTSPVELLGDDSVIVDPGGGSHPLHGQTIGAGGSIKMIFPPFPDRTPGPTFSIALSPTTQATNADPYVFSWDDEGDVAMRLFYFHDQSRIEHSLIFHRRRM